MPQEPEQRAVGVKGVQFFQPLRRALPGRLRRLAQGVLVHDGRDVGIRLAVGADLRQQQRKFAQHHRAAGVDARDSFAESQRFGKLSCLAVLHQSPRCRCTLQDGDVQRLLPQTCMSHGLQMILRADTIISNDLC